MDRPPSPFSSDALANALTGVAAVLYLIGLVTLVVRGRRGGAPPPGLLDHLPALTGFAAHLGGLVARGASAARFPVGNLHESASFLGFLLAGAYLMAAARFRFPAVEALLLAVAAAFVGLSFLVPGVEPTSPAIHSRWFVFHTLLAFLGIAALFVACVLSVLYLLADVQLKNKRPGLLLRFLPSLVACDRTSLRLLWLGFPLLSLGIATGWLWSREAGRPGQWGPKELWAVTAWLIYAALLFARTVRGWRGRKAAILGVTGAAAVLAAFFGIRL